MGHRRHQKRASTLILTFSTLSDDHIDRQGPRWALSDPWRGLELYHLKQGRLEVSTLQQIQPPLRIQNTKLTSADPFPHESRH
jgi:hypothetical protein